MGFPGGMNEERAYEKKEVKFPGVIRKFIWNFHGS